MSEQHYCRFHLKIRSICLEFGYLDEDLGEETIRNIHFTALQRRFSDELCQKLPFI